MTTRAERNNNPGNLIPGVGKIIWNGQTGTDDQGFAIFASKDYGIRAADLNLQTYAKKGYDTVHEIIYGSSGSNGWSATDQSAYQDYIAKNIGVDPNAHLDLTNPAVRQNVLANIFNFESGGTRYSGGALSDSWADIMAAASSGNPIDIAGAVGGAVAINTTNVVSGAVDAVGNAFNFDIGKWLADQFGIEYGPGGGLKQYVIPFALGAGALLLILAAFWGMIKNTSAGQTIKSVGKTGAIALAA